MDVARFPAVNAEALDGTPFVSPRDFAAGRMVALVAFAIDQRSEVESWVGYLDALVHRRPGVRARLFPVLSAPKLLRGTIVRTMKAAVGEPELRASTIPLFVDVPPFAQALGVAERSHVGVLLVEADGRIVWRGSGPYSDEAAASLDAALGTAPAP